MRLGTTCSACGTVLAVAALRCCRSSGVPTALGGRGVALVDALSTRWGVEDHGADADGGAGKTVWFVLDVGGA